MFDVHDTKHHLGVIEYGMPSYTGDENYDCITVLSAGGVSSGQFEAPTEEPSVLELYNMVYKEADTIVPFQKIKK